MELKSSERLKKGPFPLNDVQCLEDFYMYVNNLGLNGAGEVLQRESPQTGKSSQIM